MELAEIEVEKREIEEELANLKLAIKDGYISKRTTIARDLMAVYGHLKYGGKIIDLYKTFTETGLTEEGHPKLAIVQFSSKYCYLYKKPRSGGAIFSNAPLPRGRRGWGTVYAQKSEGDIELPSDTFEYPDLKGELHWKTLAPMVPPRVLTIASTKLTPKEYYILWEADEWSISKPARPPGDPILGKLLTPNIFGIIATWNLTKLEQIILRGRG